MNKPDIGNTARRVLTHLGALILCTSAATAAVEISAKPTSNMTCSAGVCSPTAKKAVLNVGDLAVMLASADVAVVADDLSQDIEFKSAMRWSSSSRLTLSAFQYLTFDKPIKVTGPGSLAIATNTARNITDFDYMKFAPGAHVEFQNPDSGVKINGTPYCLVHNIKQMIALMKHRKGCHSFALARDYDALKDGTYAHAPLSTVSLFEGFGNSISNLSINSSTDNDVVAFIAQGSGIIRDLSLRSTNIVASGNGQTVGTVVGRFNEGGFNTPVANCHATGQIVAGSNATVGGLIGSVTGDAVIVHASADVAISTGSGGNAGGLIGRNTDGGVVRSYATGTIVTGDNTNAGGLIGWHSSPEGRGVWDAYATGFVTGGDNASVGGLVGLQDETKANGTALIEDGFSTGSVSANSGAPVGGLIGTHTAATSLTNTYWNLDTSGVSDPSKGAGNIANDPGITGLTDTQFKSGLPSGFDNKVWAQKAGINNGYPYLIANPPPN